MSVDCRRRRPPRGQHGQAGLAPGRLPPRRRPVYHGRPGAEVSCAQDSAHHRVARGGQETRLRAGRR
eukprot:8858063-Lingulodinium_polyedra.AAC.1